MCACALSTVFRSTGTHSNEAYPVFCFRWKAYLNDKRAKHYHLNHFSIHQLIYLCKNLAKTEYVDDFPDQVYCLLKFLVDDPSYENVADALDMATRIADTEEQEEIELGLTKRMFFSKQL